jgi:hypothetical protein
MQGDSEMAEAEVSSASEVEEMEEVAPKGERE